jgi:Leucine-rich repeat (LRR) protein
MSAYPNVNFSYGLSLQGRALTLDETSLDLSSASNSEIEALLPWLPYMNQMQKINLGEGGEAESSRIPWDTVGAIRRACPWSELDYSFTLFGRALTLNETYLDLNHVNMDDQGALVKAVTVCMPHLQTLDMDFCGVSDEAMADIRDSLPNAEVVWRIWFGKGIYGGYSVRTNVTKILASNPDKAGELNPETTKALKYCTKVKYLDLGHNDQLSDISFCAYMPELEVAIFANGRYHDLTPLTHCPNLEYLELQYGAVSDLSPLAELKNLRHLNIAWNFTLMDISPLYDLDLERLWIGEYNPVSPAQVAEMQRRHPDCEINTTTADATEGGWRYLGYDEEGFTIVAPRYEELRRQFEYDSAPYCYSYLENDPLYYPHP